MQRQQRVCTGDPDVWPAWNTLQVLEDNGGAVSGRSALMPAEPGRLLIALRCMSLQVLEDNGGGGSCRSALMPAEPGRLMAHHCISLKTMTKICTTPR